MPVHLLLADDSFDIRLLFGGALVRAGYRVTEAINGTQALDMLAEEPPDLAILDVIMPGLDGLSVCRAARADPRLRGLKIIVISADASDDEAMAAGADRFLAKPFRPSQLIAAIDDLLEAPVGRAGRGRAGGAS